MKTVLLGLSLSILFFTACTENSAVNPTSGTHLTVEEPNFNEIEESSDYDPEMATRYGADDYGMKQYVMAFLRKGPNRDRSEEESAALQRGHMENISRLANEGKLVLAGPFLDDGDLRGIYIFNVTTIEEAQALTESDPAIQAGSLTMELIPWYGSAALVGVNEDHSKLAKKSI